MPLLCKYVHFNIQMYIFVYTVSAIKIFNDFHNTFIKLLNGVVAG